MEVLDESSGLISNYEALTLLQDVKEGRGGYRKPGQSKAQAQQATILYSTLKYLEKSPCSRQSNEIIRNFAKAVERFELTKAETLQLLNQRPTTAVEIQLIVEESEERLSEEQIEELLGIVEETLPGEPEQDEQQGAN